MPDTAIPAPVPSPPPADVRVIRTDAEALEAARLLAAEVAPGAAARDRDRILPHAEIDRFSWLGLGAINVPREFGGAEVSFATLAEVFAIISEADPSVGQIPQNQMGFLHLLRYDPDAARQRRYFDLALRGWRFGNALAEFNTRNTTEIGTRITPRGDGYVLNGRKFYSTGALFAHFIPVAALDDEGRPYRLVLPRDTPGLRVVDDWSSFGQRTTASGTVILEDAYAPAENRVAAYVAAERPTLYGPVSQIIQAAIDLGIARAAFADMLEFVRTKSRAWVDSNLPRAADDPHTIALVGDLQIKLHAAEALLARAGRVIDDSARGETADAVARASIAVAEAKVLTTEIAMLAANRLFELAGTRATLDEHGLDRHWRNARTHTLHDPVRWKYHHIGAYTLNGTLPPRHAWI